MELTRRDALAAGAAATAVAGAAALGMDAQVKADEAAGFNPNHADEGYNYTFNNGPLTSAEQHAVISEYDWRENKLSVAEIAEAAKGVSG